MKLHRIFILLSIIGLTEMCSGYRILAIYPFSVKSHFIMMNGLLKGLARKGHQIDLITMFPEEEKYPNITQVVRLPDINEKIIDNINRYFRSSASILQFFLVRDVSNVICRNMGSPEFLELVRNPPKDPPYDVIITQMLSYSCYTVLGNLWNVPVVLVSTTYFYAWMHHIIGNPENIAFTSNNFYPISESNDFWSRFFNTYAFNYVKYSYLYSLYDQNQIIKEYFGPDTPTVHELERNVSLVLINTHFSVNGARPMATSLVEIGGVHIRNEGPEITGSLKKWLDESKSGVIYFSFGSIMQVEFISEKSLEIIFKSLEKLSPIRVLMKIAKPEILPLKVPSNVLTMAWIPQEKVLQHPYVKLFVTHGGLLGTQEAIYYAVPMLCAPFAADQWSNANNYIEKKIALKIDVKGNTLTQEELDHSFNELLNNPIYRENIKKLSNLFRDRPQQAIDTANFWIEYVIRNGKDTLRSPGMDLTWWQLALLDVIAVTIIGLSIFVYVTIFIVKNSLRLLRCSIRRVIVSGNKKLD